MTFTFVMGTKTLYEWIHYNPICASYPSDICNDFSRIALHDKMFAVNNALEVDLTGQVSSESVGFTPISGPGGQLDFAIGAFNSKGGKSFICLSSTTQDKDGNTVSRIVPYFAPGTIIDVPRTFSDYVVTEYGVAALKGRPTWARAEKLINIAHPDYRDELIKMAEKAHFWRKTNKLE
jgi:acyl-CoA hydrolase